MTGDLIPRQSDSLQTIARELSNDPQLASAHTKRTYSGALADFEAWRNGRPMTKTLVEAYAAHLQALGQAPATVNHKLSAVRWWARRVGELIAEAPGADPDQVAQATKQAERIAGIENVKGNSAQRGRHVLEGEIRALLEACAADHGPAGVRDAAMLALAFATGMRRAEIAALQRGDVTQDGDGYTIEVRQGKGQKSRTVAVFEGARDYLVDWLQVRGEDPGALFVAILKSGRVLQRGIGTRAMQKVLDKRAAEASITAPIGWHDARRTLAGNLLDVVDIATVQQILGHSSPVTTARYDRRPEAARRRALQTLHIPYVRRRML